ncbi:MAG TPA: GxxExxY protein [Spirochaetales bacterium]|nr:GxxExxY protein [Spirochaetales bacterium]
MLNTDSTLTERIIGCAVAVHRELGPGLLESVYEEALGIEFKASGLRFSRQLELPILYKGEVLGNCLRVDLVVENQVVVEVKAVDRVNPVYMAQVLSYMKLGNWPVGLLLNFNVPLLKNGIQRIILKR